MREGEPLFDWEKIVIEKRRNMIAEQPSFEDDKKDVPPAPPESRLERPRPVGRFQNLFHKRDGN
jgi:hypothetical protein